MIASIFCCDCCDCDCPLYVYSEYGDIGKFEVSLGLRYSLYSPFPFEYARPFGYQLGFMGIGPDSFISSPYLTFNGESSYSHFQNDLIFKINEAFKYFEDGFDYTDSDLGADKIIFDCLTKNYYVIYRKMFLENIVFNFPALQEILNGTLASQICLSLDRVEKSFIEVFNSDFEKKYPLYKTNAIKVRLQNAPL